MFGEVVSCDCESWILHGTPKWRARTVAGPHQLAFHASCPSQPHHHKLLVSATSINSDHETAIAPLLVVSATINSSLFGSATAPIGHDLGLSRACLVLVDATLHVQSRKDSHHEKGCPSN